jgi:hypothetical protein
MSAILLWLSIGVLIGIVGLMGASDLAAALEPRRKRGSQRLY